MDISLLGTRLMITPNQGMPVGVHVIVSEGYSAVETSCKVSITALISYCFILTIGWLYQ